MTELSFKTGSWGLLRPSLDITGPLNKGKSLRYRLNTSFEQMNSFRDMVSSKRSFIAPTLSWDINNKLSLERANAVKENLLKGGIDQARIRTKGYGKSKPKADNATEEGRQINRRVEIEIL